jgi:hypothetical protein
MVFGTDGTLSVQLSGNAPAAATGAANPFQVGSAGKSAASPFG